MIPKMGRSAVDSNEVFIDAMPVPVEDRIGEEGDEAQPVLRETFAGAVNGWTPSLDHCLESTVWTQRWIVRRSTPSLSANSALLRPCSKYSRSNTRLSLPYNDASLLEATL